MSPKESIRALNKTVSTMQRQRIQMIKAFQDAVRTIQGKMNDIIKAVSILGSENPEVLKLLSVQPEKGADEASSGDEKSGILSLPGAGNDRGTEGDTESGEDKASSEAPESGGTD